MQQKSLFPEKKSESKPAPMMAQYLAIKRQYPETLLFYRMGDFYEMFFEDAVEAARILSITLTQRGKHSENPIPMCGVPVHNAEVYLRRLIASGRQVTICEQTETPEEAKKRGGSKALVERRAVRMVTAGTLLEDELLDADRANRLACLAVTRDGWGLAWLELTSGDLQTQAVAVDTLGSVLAEIEPSEILLEITLPPEVMTHVQNVLKSQEVQISLIEARDFTLQRNKKTMKATFDTEGFAKLSDAEIVASGVVVQYIERTQMGKLPKIYAPRSRKYANNLIIDSSTRRSLELTKTLNGEKKGALLSHLNRCITASGKRLFANMILSPLAERSKIEYRLDCVSALYEKREERAKLRQEMRNLPDIDRPLSRLQLGHGNPKDLKSIQIALEKIQNLQKVIIESSLKPVLKQSWIDLSLPHQLQDTLSRALAEEMPKKLADGGIIKAEYDEILDHHRHLRDNARRLVTRLQMQIQQDTGIKALKIKFNNMLGYFIEVPEGSAKDIDHEAYIHRQSIKSAARFTCPELIELAREISEAAGGAQAREETLYAELIAETLAAMDQLQQAAKSTAWLDVVAGLAQLAIDEQYTRPTLYDDCRFEVQSGRHPVVEKSLQSEKFIANNCTLEGEQRLWLLSGPNMAGKSTFLRQNALIVIMAQMGSFVPAKQAHIGIVDQLFSRVGAADDLARGHSTFMVEMTECAAILNRATSKSFVILDEIGRGTATFDGLSIAWACVEYLHEKNQSRAIFATHYHELSEALEDSLGFLRSFHLRVKEWQGEIVFMHEVAEGRAQGSYGIHVAGLAGLPKSVLKRAQQVLLGLEKQPTNTIAPAAESLEPEEHPIIAQLKAIDSDNLSPRAALDLLYDLKRQLP